MCSWCPLLPSFSHSHAADTNQRVRTCDFKRSPPQYVVSRGCRARAPDILDNRTWPECRVLPGTRILIPALASSGLPDRSCHPAMHILNELFLRFFPHLDDL